MSGQTVAGDPVALVTYTDTTTPTLEQVASSMEAVIRARDAFVQAPSMAPLDVHDVAHLLEPALDRLEVTDRIPGAVGAALAELDGSARFVGSVGAAQRHVTVRDGDRFDQLAGAYLLALLEGEPLPGGDGGGLTALQLLGMAVTAVGGAASRDAPALDTLVTAAMARAGSNGTVPAGTWKVVRRGANVLGVVLVAVEEWRSHDALSSVSSARRRRSRSRGVSRTWGALQGRRWGRRPSPYPASVLPPAAWSVGTSVGRPAASSARRRGSRASRRIWLVGTTRCAAPGATRRGTTSCSSGAGPVAEGIGMLAFGAACIVGAVVHWRGLAWTDHHPDSMAARTYLVWLPGGIACVVMGLVITFGTRLPDVLPDIAVRVFIVLMCSMLVLQVWEPERVRPEWQKRQKRWLADNQVDGRDPPRETWPEEWKRQGWSTDSARRLWRLDRDRSSEGSERDRR